MEFKLLKYLEQNKSNVVRLVSELVEIPTMNPPGENYEKIVCFLEKECRKLGLRTRKFYTPRKLLRKFGIIKGASKRVSLVADYFTGSKKTLHIAAHYDVVPVTSKWRTDPFRAVIKAGKIYARGSEDMKGNIACTLFALEAVKKCGIKPNVNIQLSFTPDEEIGGRTGLGYLVERGLVKADYAISEGLTDDCVSIGNRGILWAEVTVEGKAHHASMPHKGVNSFERMVELVSWLKKLKKKSSSTFVMGGFIEGGIKVNIVPGVTKFSIDRRFVKPLNANIAKNEIRKVIKKFNKTYKDSKVSVRFETAENPSISKKDNDFFNTVSNSIKSVKSKKAKFKIMPGATDIRYFMWKGVPSIGYSAEGGGRWHADNEFVSIKSLIDTAKVYALIMKDL